VFLVSLNETETKSRSFALFRLPAGNAISGHLNSREDSFFPAALRSSAINCAIRLGEALKRMRAVGYDSEYLAI